MIGVFTLRREFSNSQGGCDRVLTEGATRRSEFANERERQIALRSKRTSRRGESCYGRN